MEAKGKAGAYMARAMVGALAVLGAMQGGNAFNVTSAMHVGTRCYTIPGGDLTQLPKAQGRLVMPIMFSKKVLAHEAWTHPHV